MGNTKMCRGIIHLFGEKDGLGKGQIRKKKVKQYFCIACNKGPLFI
jgi:hypothetical protein